MKFILTVWICSFLNFECSPPIHYPQHFDTWNECVAEALNISQELLAKQDGINDYRLATKYLCKEVNVI
jgi:hypothetical protein|tara:strand:+ start:115 stop:321 length:207 start_codon:yes stop_codon:yes gene_type:complete